MCKVFSAFEGQHLTELALEVRTIIVPLHTSLVTNMKHFVTDFE